MDQLTANQATLNRHLAAENAHDLPGTLATLHPECVFEDLATGQVFRGHDGAARHYRLWWDAFDNQVGRSPFSGGGHWLGPERYVAEAQHTGIHRGAFLGIPASGRPIAQPFTVFVTFRDGLFLGERFYYDLSSLLRQICADPIDARVREAAARLAG